MGILAIAGAVGGAGQGITQAGEQAQKVDLATKVNQLQQAREEAIQRLQGAEQEKLQGQGQQFQREETQTKLQHASQAQQFTIKTEQEENQKNRDTKLAVSKNSYNARVDSAKVTAAGRTESKGPPKIWEQTKLSSTHIDPKLGPVSDQTPISFNHFTGRSYAQVGDKYIPWDASTNRPATDPKAIKRAPVEDLQDLMQDPLGNVPAGGPNAGLSKAEVFESAHGYLPAAWTSAASAKAAKSPDQYSSLFSAPSMAATGGKPGNEDAGPADNAAQSEEDSSNAEPSFQSNSMSSYAQAAQ